MQKINAETCLKKKKKQKENMEKIDRETYKNWKEQAKRISKKLSGIKKIYQFFCIV